LVSDRPTYKANNSRCGKKEGTGQRLKQTKVATEGKRADQLMKQTIVATGRKERVDEWKKGWTRKPENPKERKRASAKSFFRSVTRLESSPYLPNLQGVFKKGPNFLNNAPTSTESALRLLSALNVRL